MERVNRIARKIVADEENRAKRSKYRKYAIVRIEGLAKKDNVYIGKYTKLFKVMNANSDQLLGDSYDPYWEHDHWFEGDDMILVISDGDGKPTEIDEYEVKKLKGIEVIQNSDE